MPNLKTEITTTIEKTHTVKVTKADILSLLRNSDHLIVPENAEVFVDVPGGGDWSNTQLDIEGERPVLVRWTEVTHDDG